MKHFVIGASRGGALGKYFFLLANELVNRGSLATIIVDGRRYDCVNDKTQPSIITWPSRRPSKLKDAWFLYRFLKQQPADCLIGNFGSINIMMLIGWILGVKNRIVCYHTLSKQIRLDTHHSAWVYWLLKQRKKIVYSLATSFRCFSKAAAEDLEYYFQVKPGKIFIAPYLLDSKIIDFSKNSSHSRFTIVCVGRLDISKGQDYLIRLLPDIKLEFPDVLVKFIGSGPEQQRCEQLAASLNVGRNCQFCGRLSYNQTMNEIASARVLISTSKSEAFGLTVIEAQSVGTPVVGFAVDGLKETVVDGKTGYLIQPENEALFAEKVKLLLRNCELREKLSIKSKEHFLNNFCASNIGKHAESLEKIC